MEAELRKKITDILYPTVVLEAQLEGFVSLADERSFLKAREEIVSKLVDLFDQTLIKEK